MSDEQQAHKKAAPGQDPSAESTSETIEKVVHAATDFAQATVQPVDFGPLDPTGATPGDASGGDDKRNLSLLLDVGVPISAEVGRAQMTLDQVLNLGPGSVVPLDKRADEPLDLRVNGKLVARGEVVLVDDVYGLRVTQILDPGSRIESLR
ncbi:MAG: flagellar motor switch protein FliN [Planctomycetota bacterium]|jgi:flagellar motor switch protein FliN/FliY